MVRVIRNSPSAMTVESAVIDYAPSPRRWRRGVRRWWALAGMVALGVLAFVYGPGMWERFKLMRLQEACLSARAPANLPVFNADISAAQAQLTAWPTQLQLDKYERAVHVDANWVALAGRLGVPPIPGCYPDTVFCHERYTPDGRRRLVVVEGWSSVVVVEPAGWWSGQPRVVRKRSQAMTDDATRKAYEASGHDPMLGTRIYAGTADPADRSRFTAEFVRSGIRGTFEYRLGNDDRVTMRIMDAEAIIARAEEERRAADKLKRQSRLDE